MKIRDIASDLFKRWKGVVKEKSQDVKDFLSGDNQQPEEIVVEETPVAPASTDKKINPLKVIDTIRNPILSVPWLISWIVKKVSSGEMTWKEIVDSALEKTKAPRDFLQYYWWMIWQAAKNTRASQVWWVSPEKIINENILDYVSNPNDLSYVEDLYIKLEPIRNKYWDKFMNYLTKEWRDYIGSLPEDIEQMVLNSKSIEELQSQIYTPNFLSLPKDEQDKRKNKFNQLIEENANFSDKMQNNMFFKRENTNLTSLKGDLPENELLKLTSIDAYDDVLAELSSKDKRYNPKDPTETQDITQASFKVIGNINSEATTLLKETFNEEIKDDSKLGIYRQTYLSDIDEYKNTYLKAAIWYVENTWWSMQDFNKDFQSTEARKRYPVLQDLADAQTRLKTSEFLVRNRMSDLTIKEWLENRNVNQLLQWFFWKVGGWIVISLDAASWWIRWAMWDKFNLLDADDFNTHSQTLSWVQKFLAKTKNFYYDHQWDILLLATPTKIPWVWLLSKIPWAARIAQFVEASRVLKVTWMWAKWIARESKIDAVFDYYTNPYVSKDLANANLWINLFAEWLIGIAAAWVKNSISFVDNRRLEEFSKNFIREVNVPIKNADWTVTWTTKQVSLADIFQPWGLKETDDAFASIMKNMWDAETTNYIKYVNTLSEMKSQFDEIANKPTSQWSKTERQFVMSNMDILSDSLIKWADWDTTLINVIKKTFDEYKKILWRSWWTRIGKEIVAKMANWLSVAWEQYMKDVTKLTKTIVAESKATGKVSVDSLQKLWWLLKDRARQIAKNFVSNLENQKFFWSKKVENIVNKIRETGKLTEKDVLAIVNNMTEKWIVFSEFSKNIESLVWFVPKTFKSYKKLYDISQKLKYLNNKFAKYLKDNKILLWDIPWWQLWQFDKWTLKIAYLADRYKNADDFVTVVLHEMAHSFRHYLPENIVKKIIVEFDSGRKWFLDVLKDRFNVKSIKELQSARIKKKFGDSELYQALYNESRIYENVQEYFAYNLERTIAWAMKLDTTEWKLFNWMGDLVKDLIETVRPDIKESMIMDVAKDFIDKKYRNKLLRWRWEEPKVINTFRKKVLEVQERVFSKTEEFVNWVRDAKSKAVNTVVETMRNKWSRTTFLDNIQNFADGDLKTMKEFLSFTDEYTNFSKPFQEIVDNRDEIVKWMDEWEVLLLEKHLNRAIWNSMLWGLKWDDGIVAWLLYEALVWLWIKVWTVATEVKLRNRLLWFALQIYKWNNLWKEMLKFLSTDVWDKKILHELYIDYIKDLIKTKPQFINTIAKAWSKFKDEIENLAVMMRPNMSQQRQSAHQLMSTFVSTANILDINIKWNWKVIADNLTNIMKFMDTRQIIRDYPVIDVISQINKYDIANAAKYNELETMFVAWKSIDDIIDYWLKNNIITLTDKWMWSFNVFEWSRLAWISVDDKMLIFIGWIAKDFYKSEKVANNIIDHIIGNIKNIDAKKIEKYKKMLADEILNMSSKETRLNAIVWENNVVWLEIWWTQMSKQVEEFNVGKDVRYRYRNINWDVFYIDPNKNIYTYNWENQAQTLQNKNVWNRSDSSTVWFYNIYNGYSLKLKETRDSMQSFVGEWIECFKK